MRRLWLRIHTVLGLGAGAVLAVVGLTGAILATEDAVLPGLERGLRVPPAIGAEPLAPAELVAAVERQLPGRALLSLQVSADPALPIRATLAGGERGDRRRVDPYTGQLLESSAPGEAFYRSVRELHRWLVAGPFGDRDVGRQIVGACTALGALLLVSGLVLRSPRRLRGLRAWLVPTPRLFNLHAVLGTWALAPLLVITLTGLTWSYPAYRAALHALAGVPAPERGREGEPTLESGRTLARAWQSLLTLGIEFETATLTAPRGAEAGVRVRYLAHDAAHDRALDALAFDGGSDRVLEHERFADRPFAAQLLASLLALHTGSFFGLPGRLAFFVASLGMPFLSVTGGLLWLRRRARRRPARAPRKAWALHGAEPLSRV